MFELTFIIIIKIIVFSIISYLLGSFSSAYWYGRWFYKIDIRKYGSENAGTTNVLRTLGTSAAILVFITDVLKSFISVMLILFIKEIPYHNEYYYLIQIIFGICSVIGHIFPLYSGFKGGKGVASMLGIILGISPLIAVIALGIFIIMVISTRIVSLSSIIAAISFPIITLIVDKCESLTLLIFSICACLLIIITHIKNIKRIIRGEEKKLTIKKRKSDNNKEEMEN